MTLLFKETFTGVNGTTLATHVSDSGHSYSAATGYENWINVDPDGAAFAPSAMEINTNRLRFTGDAGAGDGSTYGNVRAEAAIPLDQVTITVVVLAGPSDGSTYQGLTLGWPLDDWTQQHNTVGVDAAGYLNYSQGEPYLGFNNSGGPDQLTWTLGSSHTIEFVIGGGNLVIKDNGTTVGTYPWYVIDDTANAFLMDGYSSGGNQLIDSVQIDSNALTASPPVPNPMDDFPAASGLPDGTTLYEDTFTAADGTTLVTHVSDSGHAYAESPTMQTQGLHGSGGTPATRAGMGIQSNRLRAIVDMDGFGSYCGVGQVAVSAPPTDFCWTAVVAAGGTGSLLRLNWPLMTNGDPSPAGINMQIGDQGGMVLEVVDTPNGLALTTLSYTPATPVEWDPALPHTVQLAATGGTAYIVVDGTVRASMAWPTIPYSPTVFGMAVYFGNGGPAKYDSLKLQDASAGGASPQTGNATGLASTVTFGTPTNRLTQPATGKPSSLAFGLATNRRTQGATGKASGLSFGLPVASTAPATHNATGFGPATSFGTPKTILTQRAIGLAAQTTFGTPRYAVPFVPTFTDTFTGTAGDLLSAHVADTGQSWDEPNGTYNLDASGTQLLPCFNATTQRAAVVGYAFPAYGIVQATFQPPTAGANPFTFLAGFGDGATQSFNGAVGLFFNGVGNVQVRFYITNTGFITLGSLTKAQLGTVPLIVRLEPGRVAVGAFEFSDPGIAGAAVGQQLVLQLYSNTSTAANRPYLQALEVAPGVIPPTLAQATGLASTLSFGTAHAIGGATIFPAASFQPLHVATPTVAGVLTQVEGFTPLQFSIPSTPTNRSTQADSLGSVLKFGEPPVVIDRLRLGHRFVAAAQPRCFLKFGLPRKL
jgi:hypothetical protein